jgi:hypothetical protein
MKPTDLADATARALDLLDAEDLANSDPRIFRDPELARETRQTREAAAEVWLAVSPFRVAPAEVLQELMAEIAPSSPASPQHHRKMMPWLAVSGWAAAAALAFFLWPAPSVPQAQTRENSRTPTVTATNSTAEPYFPSTQTPRESPLRKEITRLQKRLASVQQPPSSQSPRVIHLTAPGTARRTAAESRQRVHSILTEALRSAMELESTSPADSAELVIERGWLPGGLPLPADGGVIRHRHFPEQAWHEMGLLRSTEGEYLDAAAKTLWSAAPDGRGFIGRKLAVNEDVTRFTDTPSPVTTSTAKLRTAPEGFIIESPIDHKMEVVIDQVPQPEPGSQQVVVLTDSSGKTQTIPLTPPAPPPQENEKRLIEPTPNLVAWNDRLNESPGMYFQNTSIMGSGTIILSLDGITDLNSFQFVSYPLSDTGLPAKIIVEGTVE